MFSINFRSQSSAFQQVFFHNLGEANFQQYLWQQRYFIKWILEQISFVQLAYCLLKPAEINFNLISFLS